MLVDLLPADSRVALIDDALDRSCTFDELHVAVEEVARSLADFEGGVALLLMDNAIPHVIAYLACLEAGVAVALLDPNLSTERLSPVCDAHRPDLVIGWHADDVRAWNRFDLPAPIAELPAWVPTTPTAGAVHPSLALCLSTSGTTGSPKFVRLSNDNLDSNATSIGAALSIEPDEVALAHLPLHYSYGLSVLNSHLLVGSTVVLTSRSVLRPGFVDVLERHGVTTIPNVPFGFTLMDRIGFMAAAPPTVRVLTQAGGRLPLATADRYHAWMTQRGGCLHVMYGQTEGTARLSILHSDDYPELRGSVGRAVPGGAFDIVDPDDSGRGMVRYRGPNVMLGYAQDREGLCRGDELGGVLDTGDAGYLDGDVLTVTGRIGRIAKLFGLRFDLDEVERSASRFGTVAVVESDDALVVFAERHTLEQCEELQRSLAWELRLPPKVIAVHVVERLPRNAAGKLAYAELGHEP